MNFAQKNLLWREWALASKWYLAHGKVRADLDGLRRLLVRQACGSELSMSNWQRWTNGQVDKVLAKFRAIHDGGNLDAQLDAAEQPERRLGKMEAQARNLCREVYPVRAGEDVAFKEDNYLNAISRKMCFYAFADIKTEKQMMSVITALRQQQQRNERKAAEAIAAAHAESEEIDQENPFG